MNAPTLDLRLKALRLIAFLAHYRGFAEQAAKGGWSHVKYLDELAAVEATERAERRIPAPDRVTDVRWRLVAGIRRIAQPSAFPLSAIAVHSSVEVTGISLDPRIRRI